MTTRTISRVSHGQHPTVPVEQLRWPIRQTREIESPVETLWELIATPGNLELCHPFCESNPVRVWPGADAQDEIRYLNGKVYRRHFQDWFDGVGYDLEILEEGRRIALVQWRVAPIENTSSRLSIAVYPLLLQGIPSPLRWFPHLAFLRPMLLRYLKSVVGGFEWYLVSGKPVPRNHFGSHPWFSN